MTLEAHLLSKVKVGDGFLEESSAGALAVLSRTYQESAQEYPSLDPGFWTKLHERSFYFFAIKSNK